MKSKLSSALWSAILLAATLFATPTRTYSAEPAVRPNVLFILVDDLRWDALSCTGHPFLKTPNIDRIAREGVNFRNMFVTTPLCSSSRASFLTGRYAHAHMIQSNGEKDHASHQLITFPLLLQRAGYATEYVGKWHMGDDDSPRPGFDRWVSFKGQGEYANPTLNVDGKEVKTNGYVTDLLTDHAVEFLKQPHEKPFVLYLAHKAVHSGFNPAERHKKIFAEQVITRSPGAKDTLEGKPVLTRKLPQAERKNMNPGVEDRVVRDQLRCVLAIDESVGRLWTALEESKQLDSTLIIFTSDNGFFWGEHGLGDKRAAYEESIRIPLLMRYPKLVQAKVARDEMVLNVDIAPTLLELAGVAIPAEMHGRSMVPLLKGDASSWRKTMLTEYFASAHARIPAWQSARSKRWKYIHYTADGQQELDELYDLETDPHELKNLIADPTAAAALQEMKTALERLLKETQSTPPQLTSLAP